MKINKIVASILALIISIIGFNAPALAAVTCPADSVNGTADSYAECNLPAVSGDDTLMNRLTIIINVITAVLGFVAVVVIILGGVSFMTSAGDPGKVTKAKSTILYGVVGLVVVLLAFAIVNFILSSMFGIGGAASPTAVTVTPTTT